MELNEALTELLRMILQDKRNIKVVDGRAYYPLEKINASATFIIKKIKETK